MRTMVPPVLVAKNQKKDLSTCTEVLECFSVLARTTRRRIQSVSTNTLSCLYPEI